MLAAISIFSLLVSSGIPTAPCTATAESVVLTWTFAGREYGWQLLTEETGTVYSIELVTRATPGAGAWVDTGSLGPAGMPTSAWFLGQAQLLASGIGDDACMIRQAVDYGSWYDSFGGYTYDVKMTWLWGDHDSDGAINLEDPDALIICDSPFDIDSCNVPVGSSGLPEAIVAPPAESVGSSAPFPFATGDYTKYYGCTTDLAFGGSAIAAYAGQTRAQAFINWGATHWLDNGKFGDPGHPKPYEGAYNLVRGGAGGAESAYFSAVWGKKVTYLLNGATDATYGNNLREGSAIYWHRYVISGNRCYFQYWHYTSNCWRPLGMDTTGAGSTVAPWISPSQLQYFVPAGFRPGDVLGETYSNIASGTHVVPDYPLFNGSVTSITGSLGGGGSPSGSGGLTAGQAEEAFARALYGQAGNYGQASAQAFGGMMGQGAGGEGGAVSGLFGAEYTDAGLYQLGAANTTAGAFATGLEDMAQGPLQMGLLGSTAQGALTFGVPLQIPGQGEFVANISTMPDTSWAPGAALDAARILFRVLCSLFLVYRFVFSLLGVMGWK